MNRLPKRPKRAGDEAALFYIIERHPKWLMCVYSGTMSECIDLQERLRQAPIATTVGKRGRRATLVIVDLRLGEAPRL